MALPPTFTCAVCGQVFPQDPATVAEAEAEAARLWGVHKASQSPDMVVLCDPCFQRRSQEDIASMAADWQASTVGSYPLMREKEDALLDALLRAVAVSVPKGWWDQPPEDPAP
jgi:hypothetical protein